MESSLSKIIIILVALLIMLGAGVGAWYLFQQKAQPAPVDATNTQYTGSSNTQTTTGVPTQTQQQTTAPNIDAAYASLIGQLSAQKITYTRIDGSTTGAAANIYALYAKDVAITKQIYPATTDFSIQVAANDLNGDGVPEAIVYENLNGFCGTGGCTIDIYQDKNNQWVKLYNGLGGSDIAISNNKTGGYADLYLTVSDGTSRRVVRYAWSGTTYKANQTVARWDGTAFIKTP